MKDYKRINEGHDKIATDILNYKLQQEEFERLASVAELNNDEQERNRCLQEAIRCETIVAGMNSVATDNFGAKSRKDINIG